MGSPPLGEASAAAQEDPATVMSYACHSAKDTGGRLITGRLDASGEIDPGGHLRPTSTSVTRSRVQRGLSRAGSAVPAMRSVEEHARIRGEVVSRAAVPWSSVVERVRAGGYDFTHTTEVVEV